MRYLILFLGLLGFCFGSSKVQGQNINVQALIVIPPPYAPYFNQYTSFLDNQLVTVQNFSDQLLEVKLSGSITSNIGLAAFTDASYLPPSPLVLQPGETRVLTLNDQNLQYLNPDNVTLEGDPNIINAILQTGILPEGEYLICVEVRDYITNELYSDPSQSCTQISIRYADPPQLIMPYCGQEIMFGSDHIMFTWSPPVGNVFGAQFTYDLYAVEVADGMNYMDALLAAIEFGAGEFIFFKEDLPFNNYIRQPFDLEFEPGKIYAWAVVAKDASEQVVMINNGLSNICFFTIPGLDDPDGEGIGGGTGIPTDGGEDPYDATRTRIRGRLLYRFMEGDMTQSPPVAAEAPIVYTEVQGSQTNSGDGGVPSPIPQLPIFPRREKDARDFLFAQTLGMSAQDKPLNGIQIVIEEVLMSSRVPNPSSPLDYFVIIDSIGNLFDIAPIHLKFDPFLPEFRDVDYVMANTCGYFTDRYNALRKIVGAAKTNAQGEFDISFQQLEEYGQMYRGPVSFTFDPPTCEVPVDGGGGLNHLEDIIGGKFGPVWKWNPADAFQNPAQNLFSPIDWQLPAGLNHLNNISFIGVNHRGIASATYDYGVQRSLESGTPIGAHNTVGMLFPSGQSYTYEVKKNASGQSLLETIASKFGAAHSDYRIKHPLTAKTTYGHNIYRALRIRVVNTEYCSPDIILIPEEGALLQLEPEVVWVNAFNLITQVMGKNGQIDGQPIPQANVRGGRMLSHWDLVKSKIPQGELSESILGQMETSLGGQTYRVLENTYTNLAGETLWTKAVRMSGMSSRYYMELSLPYTSDFSTESKGFFISSSIDRGIYAYYFTNSRFKLETYSHTHNLRASSPEVYGTILTHAGGEDGPLAGVQIILINYMDENDEEIGPFSYTQFSDAAGIFHFKDLPVGHYKYIYVGKWGYQNASITNEEFFLGHGQKRVDNILMRPRSFVRGTIVDEHGEAVLAEVKIGSGPYFTSRQRPGRPKWTSEFRVPAQNGSDIPIIIHPLSDKYFPDTIFRSIPMGHDSLNPFNLGVIEVKEKLHRPVITIYRNTDLGVFGVVNAEVIIGNQAMQRSDSQGKVAMTFASPANEFRIRISSPDFNHVPIDEYIQIPISKEPLHFEFELKAGRVVTGVVSNKQNGAPIEGARVFVVVENHDYGEVLTETFSDENGYYSLSGVPSGFQTLRVTKGGSQGSPGFTGQSKPIANNVNIRNFELNPLPFVLDSIWGFPVEVTRVTSEPSNSSLFQIRGYLISDKSNARFRPENEQLRLRFVDLAVQVGDNGKASPVGERFDLAEQKIRLVMNNAFSVDATASHGYKINVFNIGGENDQLVGFIRAPLETTLEYFNFSYNYTGKFNLFDAKRDQVAFLSSDASAVFISRYEVGVLRTYLGLTTKRNPRFKIHEFDAESEWEDSYVEGDIFTLSTSVLVNIPLLNGGPLRIRMGDVYVTPTNISMTNSGDTLSFGLERWQVNAGSWTYDKNFGGIRANQAQVVTERMSIDGIDVTIKPDRIIMNNSAAINLSNLSLGGGLAQLYPAPGAQPAVSLAFVEVSPHDQRPHWRLSVFNNNSGYTNVAYTNLAPLHNQRLYFKRIFEYSDGIEDTILDDNQTVSYFGHFTQSINNVTSGSDFFILAGNVDLQVPGNQVRSGTFVWKKHQNATVVEPLTYTPRIQMRGRVIFDADSTVAAAWLTPQEFSLRGKITISDLHSPNTIVLNSRFFKRGSSAEVIIIRSYSDEENGSMQVIGDRNLGHQRVDNGRSFVQGSQWTFLRYLAVLTNYDDISPGNDEVMLEVTGAIKRFSGDTLQMKFSNIETGFGSFTMDYNFSTSTFTGTLQISAPLPLGVAMLNSGTVQLRAGPSGFYLLAVLDATYPIIGQVNTNFILGKYSDLPWDAKQLLKTNMYSSSLPQSIENGGIAGFYLAASKEFVDETVPTPVAVLSISSGMEFRFLANFNPGKPGVIGLDGKAFFYLSLSTFIPPCPVNFSLLSDLGLSGKVTLPAGEVNYGEPSNTTFELCACASVKVRFEACGEEIFNKGLLVRFVFETPSSFDADFSFSGRCTDPEYQCRL